jgi:hypothetical protein
MNLGKLEQEFVERTNEVYTLVDRLDDNKLNFKHYEMLSEMGDLKKLAREKLSDAILNILSELEDLDALQAKEFKEIDRILRNLVMRYGNY